MNTQVINDFKTNEMLNKMIMAIESFDEDFVHIKKDYEQAILLLRNELGDEKTDKLIDTINRRNEADMLFCYNLGYQANLNNFHNPVSRTFMDVDFEDYLRISVLQKMPQRCEAEKEINNFFTSLSNKQKNDFNAVSCYLGSLNVSLTKLAHYIGFMFANEMLYFTEPGYTHNLKLSIRYRNFMIDWFGEKFKIWCNFKDHPVAVL